MGHTTTGSVMPGLVAMMRPSGTCGGGASLPPLTLDTAHVPPKLPGDKRKGSDGERHGDQRADDNQRDLPVLDTGGGGG